MKDFEPFEPITSEQAAKLVGVSKITWYRHNTAGKIPQPARLGKLLMWNRKELNGWMMAGMPERQAWEAIKEGWGK